jgi:hypothetical protein
VPTAGSTEEEPAHDDGLVPRRSKLWLAGVGLAGIAAIVAVAVGLTTSGPSSTGRDGAAVVVSASPDSAPAAPPQPVMVTLVLESSPRGAYVYREADGHLLGRTPHREVVEKNSGRVVFRVKLDGHRSERVEMATDADRTRSVQLSKVRARSKPRVESKRREKSEPERKKGEPISPPM